ncbi:sugar transferase [Halobacteriovorax sp.]|uniref:sugar transferase n=1 Tax=Halobacteriovorax sp. TaxID=2020862 RepID=UPI00356B4AE1
MSATEFFSLTNFNITGYFYTNNPLFSAVKVEDRCSGFISRVLALIMLILFSPLLLTVAAVIKLSSNGAVFYKQVRVGKDGKEFEIIKFRTMFTDAEAKTGAVLATKDDVRVTKVGKLLRKSHIDELPQLLNVLRGEMVFIGPRPERPVFVEDYDQSIPNYTKRKLVKPGITGFAQICLPYDAVAKEKIVYDSFYIDNKESLLFNVMICYYTIKKMVFFKSFSELSA